MWSWLSLIGAAGVAVVLVSKTIKPAKAVLLATIFCGAASIAFDYWLNGRILGRDITTLQGGTDMVGNLLYALTFLSCVVAPGAFAAALLGLKRST